MSDFIWRRRSAMAGAILLFGLAFVVPAGAANAGQTQCAEKYQAAKKANTLNGQTWNEFYKQCEAQLTGASPAAAVAPASASAAPTMVAATETPKKTQKESASPAPVPTGPIVFPKAIDPKYSSLSPHLQRLKTCDDQYKANKATNSNGGLKWTQKGGGYYSLCNKHLKGK